MTDYENELKAEEVRFSQSLLSNSVGNQTPSVANLSDLIENSKSNTQVDELCKAFTSEEIYSACMSLNLNKSPGPHRLNGHFYRKTQPVIGRDVTLTIQEFFSSGKLLNELNSTILSLVPKNSIPSSFDDFRLSRAVTFST